MNEWAFRQGIRKIVHWLPWNSKSGPTPHVQDYLQIIYWQGFVDCQEQHNRSWRPFDALTTSSSQTEKYESDDCGNDKQLLGQLLGQLTWGFTPEVLVSLSTSQPVEGGLHIYIYIYMQHVPCWSYHDFLWTVNTNVEFTFMVPPPGHFFSNTGRLINDPEAKSGQSCSR